MNTFYLDLPVSREKIEVLSAGDIVYLSGKIITLRDHSHRRIDEYVKKGMALPFELKDRAILHCGPIIKTKGKSEWEAVSIGPTSSSRFSPFVAALIEGFGPNIVIGKGNLFKEAVDILISHRAVFLLAIGGCAALYGSQVKRVVNNYWEEFGMADSVWEFEMVEFGPLSVGIDGKGNNLYEVMRERTLKNNLKGIYEALDVDPNVDYTWWPQVPPGTKRATEYSTKVK
jgi:tartrate/fumarate subfamily iron-sulfur-dependent hydro-lyase beta chain